MDEYGDVEEARESLRVAARAVARAARPRLVSSAVRALGWPSRDEVGDFEAALFASLAEAAHLERTGPFWDATGPQLTAALMDVTRGVDESCASFLIGAALHAQILGGQDTAPDAILRLGERAACWLAGQASREVPTMLVEYDNTQA